MSVERPQRRYGSKAHLRDLRTRARAELGSGAEPPTLEQLLRAAQAIDEAIRATTLGGSFGRLLVADGWGYARTIEEFVEQRFGAGEHAAGMRRKAPSVRLVRERNDLDSLFTPGLGARSPEEWSQ